MEKRVCEVCGEEFLPRRKDQRGCSAVCAREIKRRDNREYRRIQRGSEKKCKRATDRRATHRWRDEIAAAISESAPTPLSTLLNAKRKPKNTSAARWRMELARRADPGRFAIAGVARV